MSALFDPAFLRALEGLRILATRVPPGGRHGEQRSRTTGAGVEFTDVRPYVPGDDFRAIDWHAYQRFDKVFLRLFLEDQDLPVYFLLDESASMAVPGRTGVRKSDAARQAIAALAYIAIEHLDRIGVHPFAGDALRPLRSASGSHGFNRLLAYLRDRPIGGTTRLVEAVRRFAHQRLRRGLAVIVSDLFDPRGIDAVLDALRALPHRLLFVRPVHPGEERPEHAGELEVVDCETTTTLALTLDEAARRRYEQAYRDFVTRLEGFGRDHSAGILHLHTEQPIVPQIAQLFPQGVLRA